MKSRITYKGRTKTWLVIKCKLLVLVYAKVIRELRHLATQSVAFLYSKRSVNSLDLQYQHQSWQWYYVCPPRALRASDKCYYPLFTNEWRSYDCYFRFVVYVWFCTTWRLLYNCPCDGGTGSARCVMHNLEAILKKSIIYEFRQVAAKQTWHKSHCSMSLSIDAKRP